MATTTSMSWEEAVQWLRDQPAQQDLVRACFYDDPLLAAATRYHASTEWRAVRELLPKPRGKALDVGAGRGIASFALARDGWQVSALEPDPSALVGAGAIRRLKADAEIEIEIVESWGEDLPFGDEAFDVVHCRQVLHHARDLGQLCQQIARVLRPGGILIATREHVLSDHEDLPRFLDSHPLHHLYGGEHAYLLDEYLDALRAATLHIERVLNPQASDINLYPETMGDARDRLARRFRWPLPGLIPDRLLAWQGDRSDVPGRVYSFVARKPR